MTNFIGKSTHPVQVKKIYVKVWALRDEIEAAIEKRVAEEGHSDDEPVYINDIKKFYDKNFTEPDDSDSDDSDSNDSDSNDSDSNEGDEQEPSTDETEDKAESEDNDSNDSESNEGDEEEPSAEVEESEGEEPEGEESEVNDSNVESDGDSADQDDEKASTKEQKERAPFERVTPDESKIAKGYVLLSDIVMDQILLFCNKTFTIGQNIVIEFQVTKPFKVTAELVVAKDIGRNSKIIREDNFNQRLQSLFLFEFPGERASLREFLQSVEPEIPAPPKRLKKPDSDEDDDFTI